MSPTPARPRWGAYGLHLAPTPSTRWLVPAPSDWRTVSVASVAGPLSRPISTDVSLSADGPRVRIDTGAGWRLALDTEARTATYRGVDLAAPEFVHPGLAATAAIISRSWGRAALHAGGFVLDGRVWGVLGDREAGKTTLLDSLATAGLGIMADDLLIVDGEDVYAGPRCLDLREAPVEAVTTTRVRDGVRHRVTLAPVPARLPLAGWVSLAWGDGPRVEPVPLGERLRLLASAASWLIGEQDAEQLLDLATLPARRLVRPRSHEGLAASGAALLSALGLAAVAG